MNDAEKLRLLAAMPLLKGLSEDQLKELAGFLGVLLLEGGRPIFAEGSAGDSLFLVASGEVVLSRKLGAGGAKELAVLRPGECFGEMALLENAARSASAAAHPAAVVFELKRAELQRWLKQSPSLALDLFSRLLRVESRRLRRTTSELALLYDVGRMAAEGRGPRLIDDVVRLIVGHLGDGWSAAAEPCRASPQDGDARAGWRDHYVFELPVPESGPRARLVVKSKAIVDPDERNEIERVLTAVGRLVGPALLESAG